MTSWVVLFVAQVWLVAGRCTRVHQRLGVWGGILAALVLLVGVLTAISAAALGLPPTPPPLEFLAIPLGDMLVFGILVGTALYFRRRMEIHKRLMLLASLTLLAPAIARIPLKFIELG
jgi:peptidoglycan/LPS O-acetylase OafA/YrhL